MHVAGASNIAEYFTVGLGSLHSIIQFAKCEFMKVRRVISTAFFNLQTSQSFSPELKRSPHFATNEARTVFKFRLFLTGRRRLISNEKSPHRQIWHTAFHSALSVCTVDLSRNEIFVYPPVCLSKVCSVCTIHICLSLKCLAGNFYFI